MLPVGAVVTSATLTQRATNGSASTYSIYAMNRSCDESSVTWAHAMSSTTWQLAGDGASCGSTLTSSFAMTSRPFRSLKPPATTSYDFVVNCN